MTSATYSHSHFNERPNLYQKMIEEIEDYSIISLDTQGIIQNWNRGAERIKGYSEPEIVGKHFSIFYFSDDLAIDLPNQLIREAEKNGKAVHEGWRKRKDGAQFWGSITITALHDEKNRVIGYSKVTRDLTEKKYAEDELKRSEERYHQMIAEVQDYAIILLSPDGIIENWNMGAEKIKGYSSKEVIGKKFELFYTPEDRAGSLPEKLLNQARIEGKALQEGWRVRKDGSRFWGTIVITALHGKDGNIIGFTKVTRDLTQKKLTEDKINAYNAELKIQNSELEQFAYIASHDLQEPLRKIRTFVELIQENYADEDFVKRYFGKLDASAQRMSDLIKSLLNYSRLTKDCKLHNESLNSEKGPIDLNEVLAEVKQDLELLISEKKAVFISDHLPLISGNRMQIAQLVSNLISNSLKFSRVQPVIKIRSAVIEIGKILNAPETLLYKSYFQIMFEDNGIGFEQQYDKVIFSLFQRLHGKQEYPGTGIGLALCKKIVENHQGFITAESQPGSGARFNVYFPENCP